MKNPVIPMHTSHTRVSKVSTFAHAPVEKKMGGRVAPASKEQDRRSSAGTMRETDRKRKGKPKWNEDCDVVFWDVL